MLFNKVLDFFTYIFNKFTRIFNQDHSPEYVKMEDDDDIELNQKYDVSKYTFVIIRD